jgi:hypothetical protein
MRTRRHPDTRGALLIIALIMTMLLFGMGLAALSIASSKHKECIAIQNALVARSIAEAGMEDARVKCVKDIDFPPAGVAEETVFSYTEKLTDPENSSTVIGDYVVRIDSSRATTDRLLTIASTGCIRGKNNALIASRTISGQLDISPNIRSAAADKNPDLYQYVNWTDHGTY